MKKGKFRILSDGILAFYCKGCKQYHGVNITNDNMPKWSFNGDYDKPTFSPSILVKSGHYMNGQKGDCWCKYNNCSFKCGICHSFITDGKIQYLSDSTHEYAGQTLELEEEEDD